MTIMAAPALALSNTSGWAKPEVAEAEALGIVPSTFDQLDGTMQISRAEAAALWVQTYETYTKVELAAVPEGFFVDTDDLYVRKAAWADFVLGVGNNKFEPNRSITRDEMITMATRVIKTVILPTWTYATDKAERNYIAVVPGTPTFADDAKIGDFAKISVYFCYQYGLVNGVGNGNFDPKGTATIQEAILIALRLYKKLPEMRPLGPQINKFFKCDEGHAGPDSMGGYFAPGEIIFAIEVSSGNKSCVIGYRATRDYKIYGEKIEIGFNDAWFSVVN